MATVAAEPLLTPVGEGSTAPASQPQPPRSARGRGKLLVLACLYATVVVQWLLMTMPSSFFPASAVGAAVSSTWQGFIFAAFPFGSMVTSPFVGKVMACLGQRATLLVGLSSMLVFMLAFGLVPFVFPVDAGGGDTATAAASTFLALALLFGSGSTLAQLGSYTMVTAIGSEGGNVGLLLSLAEVVVGLGAMLGPPVGGALFGWGTDLGFGAPARFLFPFICTALLPALVLVAVLVVVPKSPSLPPSTAAGADPPAPAGAPSPSASTVISGGPVELKRDAADAGASCADRPPRKGKGGLQRWRPRHFVVVTGLTLSAVTYGAMTPTIEVRLDHLGVPSGTLSTTTGLFFLLAGIMYMACALPLGSLIDKGCCTRVVSGGSGGNAKAAATARDAGVGKLGDGGGGGGGGGGSGGGGAGVGPGEPVADNREKRCCLAVAPHSPVLPMAVIGIGSILNTLSVVLMGPLRLGDGVALDAIDSTAWVAVGMAVNGVSGCCMVVPSIPAMLIGIGEGDEAGQAWAAGLFGAFYALGNTVGPFVAGLLMQLQVPFLCRPGDWPASNTTAANATTLTPRTTTTPVVAAAQSPAAATLTPAAAATATTLPAAGAGGGGAYDRQHCFDGTMTVLGLAVGAYTVAFWGFFCCEGARRSAATAARRQRRRRRGRR